MNRKRIAITLVAVLLGGGAVAAWYVHDQLSTHNVRGSSTVEFDTTDTVPGDVTLPVTPTEVAEPWPMYGFSPQRTHSAPGYKVRPPFTQRWRIRTTLVEFPPSTAYGLVFFAQQHGLFQAIDRDTGKVRWEHDFKHCSASSPAVANGIVYHAFMGVDCPRSPSARGLIVAMNARTGKVLWKQDVPVVESSLAVVNGTLYFGAWDAHVYAMDAKTHAIRWRVAVDSSVTDSAAVHQGTVFIGTDHGGFYALDARTGRIRWQNTSFAKFGAREYFYATPTVAYGRVYASNTDGYVYSFGEKTGKLRWARHVGSYVYSGVAVQNRSLYVGSYSGQLVVLDAATGDVRWSFDAPAAVHGTPSIIDGVVYFATLSGYHPGAARPIKNGPGVTMGIDIKTHKVVFRGNEGRYVAMIADEHALYWVGRKHLTALEPKG